MFDEDENEKNHEENSQETETENNNQEETQEDISEDPEEESQELSDEDPEEENNLDTEDIDGPLLEEELDTTTYAETLFITPRGDIHVVHTITIGDIAIVALLSCLLIVKVLEMIRR